MVSSDMTDEPSLRERIALQLFGKRYDELDKPDRDHVKRVQYGMVYQQPLNRKAEDGKARPE